jgi:hypothetical protein
MSQACDPANHQNGENHGTADQQPECNLAAGDFVHFRERQHRDDRQGRNYMPLDAFGECSGTATIGRE